MFAIVHSHVLNDVTFALVVLNFKCSPAPGYNNQFVLKDLQAFSLSPGCRVRNAKTYCLLSAFNVRFENVESPNLGNIVTPLSIHRRLV